MNITQEQIAKLIFRVSNLRYYEKEHASDMVKDGKTETAVALLKLEIDTLLYEMGLDEHFDLITLTEVIKIYMEANTLKQAV